MVVVGSGGGDTTFGYILDIVCPIGLGIAGLFFCYVRWCLKINRLIKKLLYAITIQEALAYIIILTTSIVIFHGKILNFTTCFVLINTMASLMGGNALLSILISVIRYYLTDQTNKNRIPDNDQILKNVCCCLAGHWFLSSLAIALMTYGQENQTLCHTQDIFESSFWMVAFIYLSYVGLYFGIGIKADFSMIRFLKWKNEQQQNSTNQQPIPQMVGGEEITHTIPQNASIITGIAASLTSLASIPLFLPSHISDSLWVVLVAYIGCRLIYLPLLFLLAIKKKQSQVHPEIAMKSTLQFHESESINEEAISEGHI